MPIWFPAPWCRESQPAGTGWWATQEGQGPRTKNEAAYRCRGDCRRGIGSGLFAIAVAQGGAIGAVIWSALFAAGSPHPQSVRSAGMRLSARRFSNRIKIDINLVPALAHAFEPAAPFFQCAGRVAAAVQAPRSMAPDIDVASGGKPRCRRIMMIGNAERDVVVAQQIEDIVLIPAWVTKFEHGRSPGTKQLEERAQDARGPSRTAAAAGTAPAPPWGPATAGGTPSVRCRYARYH